MNLSTSKKSILTYLALGIYISALLWATLFNRDQLSRVYFYYPFWTYGQLFSGNISSIYGIIENIILFIPAGYLIKTFIKKNCPITILIGFCISLAIETVQLLTKLGCFECDDLINNTLGTLLGYVIYKKIPLEINFNLKKFAKWTIIAVLFTSSVLFAATKITSCTNQQRMNDFTSLGGSNNQNNLLLFNCEEGYLKDKNIYLTYKDDGWVEISGTSDEGTWVRISKITLEPGTYLFGGISEASRDTMSLLLQYYNENEEKYEDLTPYVELNNYIELTLDKTTEIQAYIRVYQGFNSISKVQPAIYKK